jgi:hypothetical protein
LPDRVGLRGALTFSLDCSVASEKWGGYAARNLFFAAQALLLFALETPSVAFAPNEQDPSVLGALSDDPPRELMVNGARVFLYEFSRNRLLRESGHFRDVTYYYIAQPHLKRNPTNNAVQIETYQAISDPGAQVAQITIEPADVTATQIIEAMRAARIDAYAEPSRVLNLTVYGMDAKLADLPVVRYPQENSSPFSEPLAVSWILPAGAVGRLREAIAAGAAVQVGYETLVKLSQLESTQITWGDVKRTKAFRDYSGPSGPQYLSAAQVVHLAKSVLSELRVFHWQEVSATSGGSSQKDYSFQLQSIIDQVVDRRERKEKAFEAWLDPMKLAVPVDQWQRLVDQTRKIAVDANSLDRTEWCNKYRSDIKNLSERRTTGSSDTSFGLSAIIPDIDVPIGLDFADKGDHTNYSQDLATSLLSTEDCGQKIVQNNFKYEWDGVHWEPKSIYVYERMTTAGDISDAESFTNYVIRQRLARNTWSVK